MDDPLVCVVDDDDAVRLSMSLLIETLGLPVQSFASALDVLAAQGFGHRLHPSGNGPQDIHRGRKADVF